MKPYTCPKCGSTDKLSVCVLVDARLQQDEDNFETIVAGGDHTWDESHTMWCECGCCGMAATFITPKEKQ